jgi:hypothetical protein
VKSKRDQGSPFDAGSRSCFGGMTGNTFITLLRD